MWIQNNVKNNQKSVLAKDTSLFFVSGPGIQLGLLRDTWSASWQKISEEFSFAISHVLS
jgi:hypothetical protein